MNTIFCKQSCLALFISMASVHCVSTRKEHEPTPSVAFSEYQSLKTKYFMKCIAGLECRDTIEIGGKLTVAEYLQYLQTNFSDKYIFEQYTAKSFTIVTDPESATKIMVKLAEMQDLRVYSHNSYMARPLFKETPENKAKRLEQFNRSVKAFEDVIKSTKNPSEIAKAKLEIANLKQNQENSDELYKNNQSTTQNMLEGDSVRLTYQNIQNN